MRVAYYSPMPPERSGIADYSALLVPALRKRIDVDVAPRDGTASGDVALYHVGNDPEVHGWILERLRRRPGVVVLHDFVLHHLVVSLTLGRKNPKAYLAALERDGGVAGEAARARRDRRLHPAAVGGAPAGLPAVRRGARPRDRRRRPLALRRGARARARLRGAVVADPAWRRGRRRLPRSPTSKARRSSARSGT